MDYEADTRTVLLDFSPIESPEPAGRELDKATPYLMERVTKGIS